MLKKVQKHRQLSDQEFIQQFEDGTLPPAMFTHEAHIRLAWLEINRLGADEAVDRIQLLISGYVDHLGIVGKYNITLTVAAVRIVGECMKEYIANTFQEFIYEFPYLLTDFKSVVKQHYSFDVFNSEKAKNEFLEPDLKPF